MMNEYNEKGQIRELESLCEMYNKKKKIIRISNRIVAVQQLYENEVQGVVIGD